MVRNPTKKDEGEDEEKEDPTPVKNEKGVQVVERAIDLNLINDKINYIIGALHKIAEACEVSIEE